MSPDLSFQAILAFRLVSADTAMLARFYRALGFEQIAASPISAAEMHELDLPGAGSRLSMRLGASRLDIDSFDPPGRPYPPHATACDLIFQHLALVTSDAAAAWDRARAAGAVPISREGPVTLPESAGGVTAIKFRDPDGHPLEFLQFVRGENNDWHGTGILGIDHTAISVGDVGVSRRFYAAGGLGAGDPTLNHGPAQNALDGLDGARVAVVPMNPATEPPHIELLGYRHPIGHPPSARAANDIAATRVLWRSGRDGLVRDPDGHLHQLSR